MSIEQSREWPDIRMFHRMTLRIVATPDEFGRVRFYAPRGSNDLENCLRPDIARDCFKS